MGWEGQKEGGRLERERKMSDYLPTCTIVKTYQVVLSKNTKRFSEKPANKHFTISIQLYW